MESFKLKYKPLGSISVLIEWPQKIDNLILKDINLFRSVLQSEIKEFILDTVPAYNSLTVFFDTSKVKYTTIVKNIKDLYKVNNQKLKFTSKLWKIPVCYEDEFGIDLDEIAKVKKIAKQKIIQIHCDTIYDVYFIGFLPGFLYLGGLSEKIHFKRKSKPRNEIIKGSVGIAGNQTGIYPRESPGGWNIIGNSPINLFDVNLVEPCFAKSGDKIQFISINKIKYNEIKKQVNEGVYLIKNEVCG